MALDNLETAGAIEGGVANHEALQEWPHGPWDAVHQSDCCNVLLPTAIIRPVHCMLSPMLPWPLPS